MGASTADRPTGTTRRLAGWLAVLPFLLFSLILPGTMLARDAAGGVTVVLCAGDGLVEAVMAADGSLLPVSKAPHDRHACDWTPHGQPLLHGAAPEVPVLPSQAQRLALSLELPGHLHRAAILAAPARGPPSLL
ncbi:hypothetical protein [Paracoccus aminovorans]|uniref:hypothetical protein n=1 Tax=Paracoccus aminovorans TaxID=34004 RepID=UPI002B25AF8D|nr:hypothetical protein [Paracoccus aminovorans]